MNTSKIRYIAINGEDQESTLTSADRRQFGGSHHESFDLMNTEDIKIKRKGRVKFLSFLNLITYIVLIIILSVCVVLRTKGHVFERENSKSPLALNDNLKNAAWIIVLVLKGIFALLPFIAKSDELEEIIYDKIKLSYFII